MATSFKFHRKAILCFLKLASISIGAVLGIFCTSANEPAPLYGMPYANYTISGTVRSTDQNLPVKALLISLKDTGSLSELIDSTRTDSLGRYSLEFTVAPHENVWLLGVRDVDSSDNGSFLPKDTVVSIPQSELKDPSGTWNYGHAEKTVDMIINRNTQ